MQSTLRSAAVQASTVGCGGVRKPMKEIGALHEGDHWLLHDTRSDTAFPCNTVWPVVSGTCHVVCAPTRSDDPPWANAHIQHVNSTQSGGGEGSPLQRGLYHPVLVGGGSSLAAARW